MSEIRLRSFFILFRESERSWEILFRAFIRSRGISRKKIDGLCKYQRICFRYIFFRLNFEGFCIFFLPIVKSSGGKKIIIGRSFPSFLPAKTAIIIAQSSSVSTHNFHTLLCVSMLLLPLDTLYTQQQGRKLEDAGKCNKIWQLCDNFRRERKRTIVVYCASQSHVIIEHSWEFFRLKSSAEQGEDDDADSHPGFRIKFIEFDKDAPPIANHYHFYHKTQSQKIITFSMNELQLKSHNSDIS